MVASTTMASKTGQAKRKTGRTRSIGLLPVPNQMTISLSRYIRVTTAVTAMNMLSDKMVGASASTVNAMITSTSAGLNTLRDASPTTRISVMVTTTVSSATSVALKLPASSRRRAESNNIS